MFAPRPSTIAALLLATSITACAPATVAPPLPSYARAQPRAGAPLRYAVYEWNVDDAVERWKAGTLWRMLAAKHVDDVLAGFDDAQIATYSTKAGTAQFNAMIADGAKHGVTFELLLGDPSWIPSSGIPSLESIWQRLHGIAFAGVNLDLEPNEVRGVPLKTVLDELVASMHVYVSASPWKPVTLDLNYYYANGALTPPGYCILCRLQRAGVRSIDLMTYVRGAPAVASDAAPILKAYPNVRFQIGQSVEPPNVLPPSDSYWGLGFARFYSDMEDLNARLTPAESYGGIVIESLQYLELLR